MIMHEMYTCTETWSTQ